MSRIRTEVSTLQFQVDARKANAAMEALQAVSEHLGRDIANVKQQIADLGNVAPDHQGLISYRKQLRGLERDLKDVRTTMSDYMKGVKAADQLWQAYTTGNIEGLSIKARKAGVNGLKKRVENLNAEDPQDAEYLRAYKIIIEETERVNKKFISDYQHIVQTVKDGGTVSVDAMRKTVTALKELLETTEETDSEYRELNRQYDFMVAKMNEQNEAIRRNKGELIDANDARREMLKLTKEGAAAAAREREAADRNIASHKEMIESLHAKREAQVKDREETEEAIRTNERLQEAELQRLDEVDKSLRAQEKDDKHESEKLRKRADSMLEQAEMYDAVARKEEANAEQQHQHAERVKGDLDSINAKLKEMGEKPATPKNPVLEGVKQGAEEAKASVAEVKKEIAQLSDFQSEFVQMSDADFKKFYKPDQYPKKTKTDEGAAYKYLSQAQSHRAWGNVENADEIAKNAEENYRRVLFEQTKSGKLNIEQELAYARKQLQQEIYEANIGKSTPVEVHNESLEFKIATLEKLLEVTKKVHAEENVAIEKSRQSTQATNEQTQATEKSVAVDKTQKDLLQQKAQKVAEYEEAQKRAAAADEKASAARDVANKKLAEGMKLDGKAAEIEDKVAHATENRTRVIEHNSQKLATLQAENAELTETYDEQGKAIERTDKIIDRHDAAITENEGKKAKAQELTMERMEEMKALLEKENREVIPANTAKYRENEAEIARLNQVINEAKGEWMSYADAEKYAAQVGTKDFVATTQQMQMAKQALERQRDALIQNIQVKRENNEATAEEEKQLEKVENELKRMTFEMNNAGMSAKRMEDILEDPSSAKNLEELAAAVKRAQAQLKMMEDTVGKGNKEYDTMAQKTKEAGQRLKELETQYKASATSFEKAWSRIKTYLSIYVGAAVAMQKITGSVGDLMTLSDKMGEVRKTTGFTADEVGRLSDNLAKLDTRTNLTGLMEFSSLAGSIGLKTQEQVEGFTEAANMLAVSLPEMGNEASRTLMKIADATGDLEKNGGNVRETLERVGSTIIALRANSAAAAGPITDFVSRVGAVGAQAGISIDKIAALGATVDALGGRVEMSATALSRMIPAIRNNTFEVAKAIGMTEKELKGKSAMDQMVAIFKALRDSAKGFDTSTEEGMNAMADSVEKALGRSTSMQEVMKELNQQGARAGIVFGLLSQNVDKLEEQLETAGEAYSKNTALMDEYNKMNDTAAAKWERLKNQLEEYLVGDSSQRFFGGVIDQLRKFVDLITGNVEPALKALHTAIWMCVAAYTTLKWEIGSMVWKGLVTGLTGIKNAFVALFTVKGWSSLKDNITMMIMQTQQYIVLKWQLARAHDAETQAAIRAKLAYNSLYKSMNANIIMAVIAAVGMLIYKWVEMANEMSELDKTFQKLQEDEQAAERDVNRLTDTFKKTSVTVESTTKKHEELEKQTEALRKEVDEMNKSTDQSTEAQNALREKTDKLEQSEKDLKKATDEMNKAKNEHNNVIKEINTKYSSYLGYMLSEVTNAGLVESAHWRIVSALRAELEQKRLLENQKAIETKYGKDIEDWTKSSRDELKALPRDVQDMIMRRRSNMMAQVSYDMQEVKGEDGKIKVVGRYVVPAIDGIGNKPKQFATEQEARNYLKKLTAVIVQQETLDKGVSLGGSMSRKNTAADFVENIWGGAYGSINPDNGFQRLTTAELKRMEDQARQRYQDQGAVEGANIQVNKATLNDIQKNASEISKTLKDNKALNDKQVGELGRQLNAVVQSSAKYGGNKSDVQIYFGAGKDLTLDNAAKKMLATLDEDTRKKVIAAASRNAQAGTGGTTVPTSTGSGSGSNPYGDYNKVTDDYTKWNGDDLVNRRKEMLQRVRALANGADVQAVLSEDAKFIKDAVRKNIKTTEQAIEWYNTERLKIQEALHAKHLTNTGDWMDPKKVSKRVGNVVNDEMKYYLDELDAYYTERKTRIQEAQNDQEISEAEARNRTLANDAEWQQRRAELLLLYTEKAKNVTKQEADDIYNILSERTGDTTAYIVKDVASTNNLIKQVGQKSKEAMDKIYGDLEKKAEQSFLRQSNAIAQHLKAIQNIIDKERPFNGVTKNLKENLATMEILTADMVKERNQLMKENKDTSEFDARQRKEEVERTIFLLGEAENAWSMTVEDVMRHMGERGMTAWAEAIKADPQMQQALMAQLHNTYDAIQEAIKKEASLIKKQAENMWNNILLPGGDGKTTVKDAFEQTVAQLGLEQGRVSRANNLIGAGQASERVADKLAIQQMKLQIAMQEHYYNLMKKQGDQRIKSLERQAQLQEQLGNLEEASRIRQDKAHVEMSLRLALTKEQTDLMKKQEDIAAKVEESQARLYKELKSWADIFTKGLQGVFEAVNFYNSSDYNQLAVARAGGSYNKTTTKTTSYSTNSKVTDTGKHSTSTSASATSTKSKNSDSRDVINDTTKDTQTNRSATSDTHTSTSTSSVTNTTSTREKIQNYYIIDNAGTKDAVAREVEMSEEEYYEKKIELDRDNAIKEAWKNLLDELNMKMSETITDQINAMFQQEAIDTNTAALGLNTAAITGLTAALGASPETRNQKSETGDWARDAQGMALDESGNIVYPIQPTEGEAAKPLFPTSAEDWEKTREQMEGTFQFAGEKMIETGQMVQEAGVPPLIPQMMSDEEVQAQIDQANTLAQGKIDAQNAVAANKVKTDKQMSTSETQTGKQMTASSQSTYAKMTAAMNMYGIAYQVMSNDNLSATQKFEMFAVQAAGQAAISTLTATMAESAAGTAARAPEWMSKFFADLGPWAYPVIGATTALLGTMMGLATSKIAKSKQEIAQATGVSASATNVSAGKLMTGMLSYKDGNVNEFTDPSSLQQGRYYNVDSNDGRTYRARYMGTDPKTHITNGPEFHLVGERGREAIIDAGTTRNIQLNEPQIWQAIQTIYNGGTLRHSVMRRKGKGMAAFADGNVDEIEMADGGGLMADGTGVSPEQMAAFTAALDRNNELWERVLDEGIEAFVSPYGPRGIVNGYDTAKKEALSHGERYL